MFNLAYKMSQNRQSWIINLTKYVKLTCLMLYNRSQEYCTVVSREEEFGKVCSLYQNGSYVIYIRLVERLFIFSPIRKYFKKFIYSGIGSHFGLVIWTS